MRRVAILAGLLLSCAGISPAQQPFVSDDAEVTARRAWHFEYANTFAVLPRSSHPNLRQDTSHFVVQYGLFDRLEVNIDLPLIAIDNARGTPSVFGLGDIDFAMKWNLIPENSGFWRPAFTVSAAVEFPKGSEKKQLGSGLTDYSINTVFQKTFSTTVFHVNAGIQFRGNTQTGAVGIQTSGRILSAGLSAVRDFSPKLRLGLDLNGAEVHDGGLVEKQLQLTAGGNYAFFRNATLDFAVFAGWYSAPRVGVMLGLSLSP